MKRDMGDLLTPWHGPQINLGCGESKIEGAINLDWPQWDAENYTIEVTTHDRYFMMGGPQYPPGMGDVMVTCPAESIACIHAYHFLEHLRDPRRMLKEIQRVLMIGGVANIVVPHYSCSMAHQDLDHKHTFALDTWANTFRSDFYAKGHDGWKFRVQFNAMIAVTERNTAICTQLVKVA